MNNISQLINKVNRRQRSSSIASNCYKFSIVYFILYLLAFICSRVLAVIPDAFDLTTLFIPLGLAALTAMLFTKPTSETSSAAALDASVNSKDLFLTAQLIENSAGDYQNIVLQQAQDKAKTIQVNKVVPYRFSEKIRNLGLLMSMFVLAILFLPQWDPFGYEEVRQLTTARENDLKKSSKATAMRKDILKKKKEQSKAELDKATKELAATFDQMQAGKKKENFKKLNIQQKKIGSMWRQMNEQKLKQQMARKTQQRFGSNSSDESKEWKKDLLKGNTDKLKKRIDDLKKKIDALSEEKNAAKKQQMRSEIKKEAEKIKDFLGNGMNAAQAANSMKRALEELAMSDMKNISKESLEAMKNSMELSKEEIEKLGEDISAMREMEEMLEAIQRAKQANESQDGLDGKNTEGCKNIQDYMEKYKEWTEGQENQAQNGGGEP